MQTQFCFSVPELLKYTVYALVLFILKDLNFFPSINPNHFNHCISDLDKHCDIKWIRDGLHRPKECMDSWTDMLGQRHKLSEWEVAVFQCGVGSLSFSWLYFPQHSIFDFQGCSEGDVRQAVSAWHRRGNSDVSRFCRLLPEETGSGRFRNLPRWSSWEASEGSFPLRSLGGPFQPLPFQHIVDFYSPFLPFPWLGVNVVKNLNLLERKAGVLLCLATSYSVNFRSRLLRNEKVMGSSRERKCLAWWPERGHEFVRGLVCSLKIEETGDRYL